MDDFPVASPGKGLVASFRSRRGAGEAAGSKAVLGAAPAEHTPQGPALAARPLRLDGAPAGAASSAAADLATRGPAAAQLRLPRSSHYGGHAGGDAARVFDTEYLSDSASESDHDTGPLAEQLELEAAECCRTVESACASFRHARSGSEKQVLAIQQAFAALGPACLQVAALLPGGSATQ